MRYTLGVELLLAVTHLSTVAFGSAGFTVHQQATGKKKFRSGPIAVYEAYAKWAKEIPENIKAAAVAAQSGSVSASPESFDSAYLCPVQIGTPSQTLQLDFDTGSSDLWVFSTQLPSSEVNGQTLYDPGASSTASKLKGETWRVLYADNSSSSGNIFADKVVVGGVTATAQAVEAATSVAASFTKDPNKDGLLGLAYDVLNGASPNKVPTFFDTVKASLPLKVFASYLRHGEAGAYDFGFIDSSKHGKPLKYVPVDKSIGVWQFKSGGYAIGSGAKTAMTLDVIADTGTSLMYLPTSVANDYYLQVDGAGTASSGYIFPCNSTLPNLSLIIAGTKYTVPGRYINYAPFSGIYCFGGLQSSAAFGVNLLGDVFLKSVYTIFDVGKTRIGFAPQKPALP